MKVIYLDLHIHTSEDANKPNASYDIAELVRKIKEYNGNSDFMISLTDHNIINKDAYLKGLALGINMILGVELHIKHRDDVKAYHCHMFINCDITSDNIDNINKILNELYPEKLPTRIDASIPDIQDIINSFDDYDFILLPHGSQRHGAFNYSIGKGKRLDNAINRSIYYNQFDGFTARSNDGLEQTIEYFKKLGIAEFVNLLTCSDNYSPSAYPATKSKDTNEFVPTWMFAEPTFDGLRLSLSESSRLVVQKEKPDVRTDHIGHIVLKNEHIDIDVTLSNGLNVVIGGSSSGKTLFVDSIYNAINHSFDGSKYIDRYGVQQISVENPSNMRPYYISQNFIAENISDNNEKSIDEIEILHNIFPSDKEINQQITSALNSLNTIVADMLNYVATIESCITSLNALPHPGMMVIHTELKRNIYNSFIPKEDEIKNIEYTTPIYEEHLRKIQEIKAFLENNPLTNNRNAEFQAIENELNFAYKASNLSDTILNCMIDKKKSVDISLRETQGIDQERIQNKERLLKLIAQYVSALKGFYKCKKQLSETKYSFSTKVVESMGHKLSIHNNFKFDETILIDTLNQYLKFSFKRLSDVIPENLFKKYFKERPRVETYDELGRKIQSYLSEANTKSYQITTSHGVDFNSLSPGWKTAILLDLILGYKDDNAPIIIDQPEDNLAVKYINSDLVDTIKRVKSRKQVILVSHNATIPMMADAQTIVLCENDGAKITIRSASLEGSIGDQKVLDYIADQTDGGKSSIKKRVKKYNFKKFN